MAASLHYSFADRRVLVTGGASGIGLAIVRVFYADGAQIFVLDSNESLLQAAKTEMPKIKTFAVDLLNWSETKRIVESLAPLDHLVNNVGIFGQGGKLVEDTPEFFDQLFGVNVKAALNVSQAFVKGIVEHRKTDGGTIVNISSIAAEISAPGSGIYAASKAALAMLTKSMALEFAELNNHIRVNSIYPGMVYTALYNNLPSNFKEMVGSMVDGRAIIKHRAIDPKDIANGVLFLSSPLAEMITGTSLTIDQGFRAT